MDPASLAAAIDAGAAPLVVDVRSHWEYCRDHIPGAVHIPVWRIRSRHPELQASPQTPIVLYCGHGPRARLAQSILRTLGYRRVGLLRGHWVGWRKHGAAASR